MLHQDIICKELTKIKNANKLHLLHLSFNSNMTIELCNELVDLMSQTKHSLISCSIDGVGKVNDYIRSDSVWEEIDHNMKLLSIISKRCNNFSFNVHAVYNVFNAHCFDEITTWGRQYTEDVTLTIQMSPDFQDARNLPDDYKFELIEKYSDHLRNINEQEMHYYATSLKSIIVHLKNTQKIPFNKWVQTFKKHNDFLDKRRHVNLIDVNPRLYNIINE
jgi:sulfatase maturation enzyme AslB (radical SAM superfamily)